MRYSADDFHKTPELRSVDAPHTIRCITAVTIPAKLADGVEALPDSLCKPVVLAVKLLKTTLMEPLHGYLNLRQRE